MFKVRKIAKSDLNSWVDISQTATAKASGFCLILWIKQNNFLPEYGVSITHGLEMLKVRKIAKLVHHLWLHISGTTTV